MVYEIRLSRRLAIVIGAVSFVTCTGAARGQTADTVPPGIIAGGRPSENVSAGAVGARAPGRLVSAGVSRASGRLNGFFVPPEITETARASAQTEFLLDAIPVLFEELNRAIFAVASAILAREGIELPNLGPQFTGDTTASALAGLLQKRAHERATPARAR